jgi:hypothetical protein
LKKLNMAVVVFSVCLGAVGSGAVDAGDDPLVVVTLPAAVVAGAAVAVDALEPEPLSSPPPQALRPSAATMPRPRTLRADRRTARGLSVVMLLDMAFSLFTASAT